MKNGLKEKENNGSIPDTCVGKKRIYVNTKMCTEEKHQYNNKEIICGIW